MKQHTHKVGTVTSWLILIAVFLVLIAITSVICVSLKTQPPTGLPLIIIVVIPAFIIRHMIVKKIEKAKIHQEAPEKKSDPTQTP